jgi:hypothetical protein
MATRSSSHGITRDPTTAVNARSATTLSAVNAIASHSEREASGAPKIVGSNTSASTVKMSSTTSHPTAMCPAVV